MFGSPGPLGVVGNYRSNLFDPSDPVRVNNEHPFNLSGVLDSLQK